MSYWFSFLRSGAENDEEEAIEPQPGTSTESEDRSTTSMLRGFPEDQRRHIRNVLERAEKSKTQAKVVVDSGVLQHVKLRQEQRDSCSEQSFDNDEEELLQMESMDDTMEVTLGPSRDYSPFVTSDMSLGDSNADDRCYTPSISIDVPMDPTPEPNIVTRGVKLLSAKIMEWVKSLDEEDGYVSLQPKGDPFVDSTIEERSERFYDGSIFDDYCSHLARNLCILAISDYMNLTPIQRVQHYNSIVNYAQHLTETIITSALTEIRSSKRKNLARNFSRFVAETIDWAVREAVSKQTSRSFAPKIVITAQSMVNVTDEADAAYDSILDNVANELASQALHTVITELQFEDQPTTLTTDAAYVILSENESPQPESTIQTPSDEEHLFEVTDSNVYNILNEFADNEVPLDSWKHAQHIEGHLESDVNADLTINEEDVVQIIEAENSISSMSSSDENSEEFTQPEELTAEELEQILRVQQRAEEMQLFDLPQTFDSTPKTENQEITEEEWTYIRRVERISEQEDQLDDVVESEEVEVPKYFYERHTTSASVFTAINLESPAAEELSNSGSSTPIELTETPTKQSKPIAEWIQVEEAIQSSSSSSTSGADDFDSDSPTELVESFPIDETDEDQMIVDEHSAIEVQQTRPVIEELTATELEQIEQTDLVKSFEIDNKPSTAQSSSTLTPDDSEKTESPDSQFEESIAESILMPKDEIYESNETATKSSHQLIPTIEIFEVKTPASSPTELSTSDQFAADDLKQLETIEQVAQQLSSIEATSDDVCPEVTIEVVPQSPSSSPTESADDLTDSEVIDSFPIEDSQSADELDATSPVTVIEVKRSAPPRPPAPKKTRPTDFNYSSVGASANYDALFIPEVMIQPPTPLIPRSDSDEVSSVYTTSDEDSRDEKQLNQMAKELAITALKSVQSELKSDVEDQLTSLSTDSSPTTSGADDELSIASMTRDSFEDLDNISTDERADDQYMNQTETTSAKESDYERRIERTEINRISQQRPLEREESTATSSADSEMADESETMETHEQTIPQSITEQEHQLTLEELRHIERIQQMAEEQELFSHGVESNQKLQSQHSSATSADNQLATEPSFDTEVEEREQLIVRNESPATYEFLLSADELAHIAMIERMAKEMDEKTQQIPADLESQQSSAINAADSHVSAITSVKIEEPEEPIKSIETTKEDIQLTNDELAHIERIRQMAEAYQRNQTVAEIAPIQPSTFELTAEELEQIERVKRMAETFGFTNHDEIETKETSTKPPFSWSSSSSVIIQDEEESFEHLRQLADDLEKTSTLERGSIERSSTTTSGADKTSTRHSPMPSEESGGLVSIVEDKESFEEASIGAEQETKSSRTESADKSEEQSDQEDQIEISPTDDRIELDYQQTEIVWSQEETTAIPSNTTPLIVPTENNIEMLKTSVEDLTAEVVESPQIHKTEELQISQQKIDEEFTIDTTVYGVPVEPIHYVDVTVFRIEEFDWLKKKSADKEQNEEIETIKPTRPVQLPQISNSLPTESQEALIPPIPPRSTRMPPILRRVLPHEMSPTTPTSTNSSEKSPPSIMAGDSFEEDELLTPSKMEEEEMVPRNQPPPIPPTSRPIGQYKLPVVKLGSQSTSLPAVANGTIVKEQPVSKKDGQLSVVKTVEAAIKKPPPRPQPPKLIQPQPIREQIGIIKMDVQKTSGKPFVTLQSVAEEIERPLFIDTIHSSNSDNEPCYGDSEPEAQSSTITSGADSDAESLGESSSQRQSSVEQDLQFSLKEVEQTFETISTFDTPVKEEEESTITSGADTPALSETSELTQPSVDGKTKLPPQRPPPPVKRSADLQTSSDFMPNELLSKTEPPIRPPPPSNFALTTDELAHISMIQKMSAVDSIVQPEKISEYVDAKLERQSSGETSSADSQQQESMDRSISSVTSGADENSIDFSDFDYDDQQSAMKIEDRVQRLRSAHHYRSFYESPGNINEGPFFAKLMEPQPTITEQTPEFNQIKLDYVEQFVSNTTDLPTVMSNFAFVHEETESSLASSEGEIADYGQEDEDYELSEHSPSESPQIGELNEVERRHIEDVKKIAAQLSTNAFDNVYQDIAANEMYARRLAKWKAQAQQSEELELNYDEEELPVCVDEKQEVDIVESLTANVFDTATSEVLFAIPIERKLSSQQQESMVQFTEEELEHFARIQQMAEQMDGFIIPIFQAPEIVDVPQQTQSDSLTEEELQHIARVQQMADDISLIDTQQPLFNVQPKTSQFTLEKQSSSLTSGADEISERESVTDVSIENVPKVVQRQSSEQSTVTSGADEMSDSEVPVPEYAEFESPETTQEEPLVHILDRLESSSPIDVQTVSSELQSEPVLEFVSEPQTRMLNEQLEVLHQSFQYATYDSPDAQNDGPFETENIKVKSPVATKEVVEELTQEELDHIARIQQMAEQMDTFYMPSDRKSSNLTIDESTNHTSLDLPIPNVEETKSEGSTPTSSADSQVDASFDEGERFELDTEEVITQTAIKERFERLRHLSYLPTYESPGNHGDGPFEATTIELEVPVKLEPIDKDVVEELTKEELDHIARIQQMAEQMSRFDTQYSSDVQPKTSQFTLEKQSSSLTSGADKISERESVTDVSIENVPKVVQRQSSEQSTVTSGADEMSDSEVPVPEYLDQFLQKLEDPELPDAMREGLNANEYGHIELIKQAAIEQQKLLHKDHLEETSDRSAADSEAEDQLSSMQMVADKIAAFDSLQYSMPTRAFAHEISMDVNVASEASSEVQQFSPSSSTSNYKAASVKSEDSFEKPELSDAEEKSERQPVIFVNPSIMSIEVEDYDLPTAMREGLTAAEFGHIELIKQAGIEETRSTVEFATIKNANFQVSVESSPPTSGADTESERESPSIDPFVPIKEELEVKTPATSSTEIWAFEKTADTQLEDVQLLTDQLSTIETVNNKLEDRSTDIDRHELAGVLELSKPVKSEVENIVDESKLTLEEIDHIERVRRLAEEMDVDSSLQFSPLDWFNSTERTITREHVTRRPVLSTSTSGADELDSPTDFEENETPTPNVEAEESCYVQNVQQSVDIEWQNWRPITPLEVIHEVAESTEINEKIGETNWPKVEIQIDAKPESVEDNLDFMETSQELIQSQLVPQAETTTSIAIKLSTKLTAEELEHIARIQQMAEQMGGFDVPIFSAQPIAVETTEIKEPQYTQPSDLSAAELEHINQIEFMAEQMSIFDSLPESSKFPLERQSKSLTSGADEEIVNEDESERNDYEDLRNAISAEYPKSPSEDFEIEQRIVQQPSITSTATSGADATISTTTINESVDEAENESFLTADYRPEKRASWANIEERESEPDLGALEIERIKRLRRAAEEMEMNDTEAYQLFDQLVDKREESPDKLSNELKSVSPIDVHTVNSEVLTKPILGFATEPQTKKIRNQIQRLKHISYRATYESPGNHGDGPFEATLIDMKLPLRLESEDKDVVEELTEEELKQIDIYSRQQSFVEHQESSSTSGADMETMPSVDIEETIFEQTSIKERFERLRHLSYLPTYESPGNHGDGPFEATTIELEVPVKLEPIDKDVVEELTKEELDHIARIQQMAEQMSRFDTQYSSDVQPKTSQFTLEKQSSSLTSGADKISERESVTDVSIENVPKVVQRQSSEQSTVTSGADEMSDSEVPVPEYAEFESPETTQEEPLVHILDRLESSSPIDVQTVSSELQSEPVLEFVSEPQTRMLNEQLEVLHQSFQYATYDSPDAQNDGPFETENIKVKSPVATKEVVEELTQEELDHIARIQQMAEHMNAFDPFAQFESKEPGVEGWTSPMMADLNVPKSKASTPTSADSHIEALTSFDESEKMETFVQTAINEHTEPVHQQMQISVYETANDDVSSFKTETIEIKAGKTTLTKDVVQELTPEELEHIARIQRMAEEMDSIPDPAFRITNQIQSSKLEKTSELLPIDFSQQKLQHQESSATSGADMESVRSFEEPTPIHDTTTVELTAEELAHIAKIQQMAEQIDLMPFDKVQLPDFNSTPFVEPESELTQEELEHIAKVTQMAENWANFGTTIQEQPIASEFSIKEPQTLLSDGSETDDSLRREEEPLITPTDEMNVQPLVFEPPRRINPFITRQTTKPELKPVAPVKIEEPELTLEEINHIEQIRRMAEMSMADTADLVFPIPPAVSHLPQQLSIKSVESSTWHSSSATSGADSERSDKSPDLIVGDSFEDRELLEKPAFEEQTTTELLQIAEDLHDDLEHSTVTSSADSETALSFDMEEKETSIPRSIQEPVETDLNVVETNLQNTETISRQLTASSVTSGADSDPMNRRLSPTEIFGDSFEDEALLPSEPTIQFDSTTHRVQDQNSLNDQWPGTELTAESCKSSTTSSADSIGSRTEESKSMEEPIEFLTSDEIAHIERIQRLAEEMEMLETKIPIETREFDSTAQTKDERTTVQKSFDHHYRLPSTVDEIDLVVDETPEKSEISKPYDWRSAIQQSSQTTISYTDRLRRSLPHEYIHSSYSVEETRFKRRLTEKSSSVQIIYPQSLTADQRKLSWTAETTSRRSIPTITTTQPAVEPTINPFEECERRSVQQSGSMLCNIDFMVKLNFLARRITENIAEAAADDLSKVIQMKSNPRARYFGDDYLLEFLDSQSETSEEADDEIPTFDMKLDYEVETIHEDAIERPAFDIFGMFRRKSTVERPRSALAFLQQRRYSPLPVPEVSSRKGSEVRSGDIMHLLHRTSIGSTESSRADSSFNLPIDALENLSAEEREHIQRVMANASRSHTTPQDSRRSSSAMRSLPSMDELSEKERQHISEVMLKAEQRQAPFIISPSINKSRSTGDRLDEQARELLPTIESMDKPEIISESSLQETQQLTEAELLQIAQVQERIAAVEAEDKKRTREAEIAKIENEFRASKAAITTADATATQQKSSSFGGFRMGIGSLKSALKKTQQKVNENVNSIVQSTNQVIDKPTESLRKLGPTPKLEPTNEMETPADDRAKSPTFELDYTPKFTHPIESMENEPSALFLQSTLDLETATSPPSSGSSSTESADRSLNELDDAVVYADENIAWLQERIEAMNQTLEAYETEEISPNEDANSQRQNEFAVDEQTAANGMMESVDAKWPEDLVGEADDETDFYEHEVRLRAAKETKRDGRRAGGDEEAAAVAFLGHANRPEKDEKDEKTTEEARNTVATTTFGGEESPRNELPSALPTSSDSATPIQSSTITPDRSFGGMFSSGKSTGFGGFGGFGKLASGALKGAKQASEQLQAKAQQAAQIAQQAASTGDLTQIGSQLTAPTRPSRSQSAANMNAEPTTPAIDPTAVMPGMEHLSEEERMKIMAVMACAEIDSTQPVQSKVVEKPSNEPTAKEIAEAAALGLDEEALRGLSAEEREQIISVMKMAAADDVEVTTKPIGSLASTISPTTTGIATERPISPKPSDEQPRVSSAVKSGYVTAPSSTISSHSMDQPLVNDIVQTEPLVDREEKLEADYYLVDSESYDKHLNKPLNTEPLIIQQEPPSLYSDYEQMGPELSTIVEDVQEPQIEDDDLWIQQPRQEYRWDEGNHQRAGRMWETVFTDDGDMAASEYDEIQPHVSYEQRDPSPIIWQANSAQLPQQEQAELIYESQDQQNRMELYGRTADGSFEVQMEDPLSPTTMIVSSTLAENAVAKAEREITKRTPEITVTQEEEDSDAETSPSDEDDYPDQVIAAPTAPMTPNQMEKQEQENADAAQEVLRQIQSFGEAADDEFDVRWASSMNKKEQSIEPTVTKLEEPKAEPAKRINPFLDSPEDEEPEVTVEQVNLDSDDVEYNQAVHSYYKNSELYHRPGPVYTIPEGDEGTSPKPNRESRYNPQLLERRPLHGTTVPSLVPVDMKRKPKDPIIIPTTTSTTGSQIATTTSVTTSNGPITPIRTAPPPPTDKVDETENQQRRHVHQGAGHFTTDIPQPDDFIPIHTTEPPPSCVAPSDAAFLEQTFGSRVAESSTLGSQLPSADHAVHDVTEEDQTTPRLKRSPAMIIPTDKPITTTADHFQYPTTTSSAVRYVDEDALLQSAAISEMGRRKLPSLPANHSTSLAQLQDLQQQATSTPTTSSLLHYHQMRPNAPIYYTHPPEQKDASIQHSQQSTGVSTGNVLFSNVYFDSKNTAASRLVDHRLRSVEFDTRVAAATSSVATSTHPVDPAIIPGAQFRSAPVPTSTSGPRLISSSSTQRCNAVQPSKISDTIAQLLFKQELRQALSRRRFAQETTEIEANHREFVIRRMLTSGLIPAELRREIDAQPDVVHCDLPYELIAGARVVPPGRDLRRSRIYGSSYSASASTHTSPQRPKSPLHFPRYTTQTDKLRSDYPTAVGSWSSPSKKSVGCQSEPERSVRIEEPRYGTNAVYSTDRFASDLFAEERAPTLRRPFEQSYGLTSPRHGLQTTTPIQRRPLAVDSATQTLVASETQTDGFLESDDVHHSSLGRQSKRIPKPTNVQADYSGSIGDYTQQRNAYAATDDLLEATRSYFEEYDRRLRDGTDAYARSRLPQPSISNSLPASTWNLPSSSEETAAEMEWKRRQVAAELERRKARVASLIDLRNSTANWNDDWRKSRARERPYDGVYGSLPRGYTNERDQWDTQIYGTRERSQPYGSLPRDFERWMDVEDADELYRPSRYGSRRYGARIDDYGRRAPTEDATLLSDYANYVNAQINAAGFLDDPAQMDLTPRQRPAFLPDDPTTYRAPTSRYDNLDENYGIRRPTQSILRSHAPFVGSADDVYTTTRYPPGTTMTRPRYGAGPMTLQQQSPSADFVYSRREANYGARPLQPIGDYGNYELRRAMDYANRNPVGADLWQQPTAYHTPTSYQQSVGYQQPASYTNTQIPSNLSYGTYTPAYRTPRQPVNSMPLNGNWDVRWPTTQPTYPPRMPPYTCSTQPRPQPQPYYQPSPQNYQPASVLNTASLGRNEKRTTGILSTPRSHKHQRNGQSMQNLTANRRSPQQNDHQIHSRSRNGTKIKRLLLTRLYRHANVYHDLGFRVTGGKRLSNGDLGAFITAVNRSRSYDTLGEVKEGDQVLEWNGVLLRGKTFEEVERIIDATSGEIEIVVKSGENKSHKLRHSMNENIYDLTTDETKNFSPREAPPVPAHRKSISRSYVDQEDISRKQRLHYQVHAQNDNYGQLQLALGYDQLNGVLLVTVISAQGLRCREYNNSIVLPNPFVKIYLLPGRKVVNKRRTKYVSNTLNPEWHQTVDYLISYDELPSHYLELTVWDYDKYNDNICLGQLTLYIDVSMLDNVPRFYELQPADKMLFPAQGVPSNAPYTKPRTITNSNYFYNPANLDLGYPAI